MASTTQLLDEKKKEVNSALNQLFNNAADVLDKNIKKLEQEDENSKFGVHKTNKKTRQINKQKRMVDIFRAAARN